jgi:hypothetical protein
VQEFLGRLVALYLASRAGAEDAHDRQLRVRVLEGLGVQTHEQTQGLPVSSQQREPNVAFDRLPGEARHPRACQCGVLAVNDALLAFNHVDAGHLIEPVGGTFREVALRCDGPDGHGLVTRVQRGDEDRRYAEFFCGVFKQLGVELVARGRQGLHDAGKRGVGVACADGMRGRARVWWDVVGRHTMTSPRPQVAMATSLP